MERAAVAGDERRRFLRQALALGGGGLAAVTGAHARAQDLSRNLPPNVPEWQTTLGAPILTEPYGVPSKYEANVRRRESPGLTRTPQSSVAFAPLQNLFGILRRPVAFRTPSRRDTHSHPHHHR